MPDAIIPPPKPRTMDFATVTGLYQLAPEVTNLALVDQIWAKQRHLEAMLFVGGNTKNDECWHGTIDDYFWSCHMAATEIKCLTDELIRRIKPGLID